MLKLVARLFAHVQKHRRKYLIELALLVPLILFHSPVLFALLVAGAALLVLFREYWLSHARKHHRKLAVFAVLVSAFYIFGSLGVQGTSMSEPPVVIGGAAAHPAADPFEGRGLADISASGVDQHAVGDCFFESALASEAESATGRLVIYRIITINRDGTYTDTFRGDPAHPVQVTAADLKLTWDTGEVRDSKLWARVIETGFLKYDHAVQFGSGIYKYQKEGIPFAARVPPGGEDQALALLTGESVATDALSAVSGDWLSYHLGHTSEANLDRRLAETLAAGQPVTAMAADATLAKLGFHDPGLLVSDHIFSVLKDGAGVVTVRNPWGSNKAPFDLVEAYPGDPNYRPIDGITSLPDGKLKMSIATFEGFFSGINFAGVGPTANDFTNIKSDISTGSLGYFFGDSLYTICDVTDRTVANVATHTWRGLVRAGHDIVSLFA